MNRHIIKTKLVYVRLKHLGASLIFCRICKVMCNEWKCFQFYCMISRHGVYVLKMFVNQRLPTTDVCLLTLRLGGVTE